MYLFVLILVLVLYTSSVECHMASLPSGIHFVGCFTNAFSRQNEHGVEVSPLTWEVCVRLCMEKDSRYAGIEARSSTCYCGNNLAQQSEKVAPYRCDEECYADRTKTCGGDDNLLSLYQIKDASSFSFLATTDNGLAYFKNNSLSLNFVSLPRVSTIRAAYHYAENTVYFHANKQIYRSQYIPLLRQHIPPVVLLELQQEATSLALDWVHSKLFWALSNSIVESNLDGSNRVQVVSISSAAHDLTVDPYDRNLFYISNGTINRLDLNEKKIVNNNLLRENRFERVANLAVDLHKKVVYAIGSYVHLKDSQNVHLVSTDYEGVMFRVLLRRAELSGAFALSALNDQLFWAELSKIRQRRLYSLQVPAHSHLVQPTELSTLPQNVVGVTLYHEDAQTRGETYFCQRLGCSHKCSYSLDTSAKCDCPQLMILARDHKTCEEIPGVKKIRTENFESSDEIDDDLMNLSLEISSENNSRSKKKKYKSRRKRKRSRRKRKGTSEKDSLDSDLSPRSLPVVNLFKNITHFVNTTV